VTGTSGVVGRGHGIYVYSLLLCIHLSVISVQLLITRTVGWAKEVPLPSCEVWEGRGHGIYMYSLLLCIQFSVRNVQLIINNILNILTWMSVTSCRARGKDKECLMGLVTMHAQYRVRVRNMHAC
jgi:hypothetical protein